jgi:hypothetical protein
MELGSPKFIWAQYAQLYSLAETPQLPLSWLTNSALVYVEPKCGRRSCGVSANEYSCAHGAQINLGELTPYSTHEYCRLLN